MDMGGGGWTLGGDGHGGGGGGISTEKIGHKAAPFSNRIPLDLWHYLRFRPLVVSKLGGRGGACVDRAPHARLQHKHAQAKACTPLISISQFSFVFFFLHLSQPACTIKGQRLGNPLHETHTRPTNRQCRAELHGCRALPCTS